MSTIEERLRRMRGMEERDETPVAQRNVAGRLEAMRTEESRWKAPRVIEIDGVSGAAPHVNAFGANAARRMLEEGTEPQAGGSFADILTAGLQQSAREDAGGLCRIGAAL